MAKDGWANWWNYYPSAYDSVIICAPCINRFWSVSIKCESTFISFHDDNTLLVTINILLVSCKKIISL